MKKRLFGIVVLILVLTGIIGYGIASSGLKLVGDAITSPIEESQDLIVLNENQPQDALPIQPESSPSLEPTPEITPSPESSPAESSGGVEALSLPSESASEPVSGSGGGGFGIASLSNEIGDQVIKPGVAPKSSVDYFTNIDETSDQKKCNLEEGVKKAYLNYDDAVGHGTSKDNSFTITNVQTKLDELAFVDGVCDDGNCGDLDKTEYWHTKTNKDLAEGWHTLWGRAKNAKSNLEEFSVNNSCMFCIDKQDPGQPGKPAVVRKDVCDPLFENGESVTFSWTSLDNGCAGVSFFDVFVEIDVDGEPIKKGMETTDGKITIEGLEHGNKVRISVVPEDKAGNQGPVSEWSDWIMIDNINPEVEITNENADEWVMGNLEITENDSDENLFKCFYKVRNAGEDTVAWTETLCNTPFTIDTATVCPVDGKNKCWVYKKAQDKACNERTRSKQFDVDNHGPVLEKMIGEPSYFDGKFLRTFTPITVTATDLGSGVNQTCYKFTNVQTGFTTEEKCAEGEEIELTFGDNESQHDLVFWATDMKGLRTEMNQTHFVDETPPVTAKTYSSIFPKLGAFMGIKNFTMDWISEKTEITLKATDQDPHPSGVNKTLFRLFVLNDGDHTEWYGTKTGAWYDDEDACSDANKAPEPAPSPIPPVNESNMSENQSQNESDNGGIGVAENGNCVAVSGWKLAHDWAVYNEPISFGDHAEEDADHHALPHKICFKSVDNVENEEQQKCQVFFIDNAPPAIIPLSLPNNQCRKSVTADIVDLESGVMKAWVEWIDENGTSVLKKNMRFQEELVQLDLSKYQWDATFTPEELAMLNAGNYTVRITAEDGVGNMNMVDIEDQLKKVVCVLNIAPSQCIINSMTGGGCMFNFNVIVRGGNAVQMGMENLFGLSPQNLSATISNSFGSKAVGNDMLWNGGTLQINNTLGSNRGSFKLGMNIPASVTGTEVLDYFLRPKTV